MNKTILASIAVALLVAVPGGVASAGFTIQSTVGGSASAGASYSNFDSLPLGSAGGTSNGVGVAFSGTAAATVEGSVTGQHAAPALSGLNNQFFGPLYSGPDATHYLSTGTGSVTLTFADGPMHYLGLLWGSIDNYNSLTFFDGSTELGTITGSEVLSPANGNTGAVGTAYVNINSTVAFTSVVASSTSNAFELDNVAYAPSAVPEPSSLALCGIAGVAGLVVARVRRKRIAG